VRRLRYRRLAVLIVLVALVPVVYSYVTTVLRPSSVPLGVRSVEWLRANGAAWLVNDIERVYYSWTAPKKGGPALRALPSVGTRTTPSSPRLAAYRPPRIRLLLQPRLAGEGVWHSVGPKVSGRPPVLVAAFRPQADYPRVVAYVAWIDHTVTQVALYPGRYEPPSRQLRGPMEVPYGQRWRLAATFNSGFTYRDGNGGFAVDGRSYTPLVQGLGTLVGYRNGDVDVITWHGGPVPGPHVAFARQNLPLIVDNGRPGTELSNGREWGATLGNAVLVWRSGVGVDRRGNVIYAAAPYQTVRTLASILIRAGAVRAIELDINAEWPSFNTYLRWGARDASQLIPNGQQRATRYLVPDDRDFFAVYRRIPKTAALVPFK
jgi:hypothetical protein